MYVVSFLDRKMLIVALVALGNNHGLASFIEDGLQHTLSSEWAGSGEVEYLS